MQTFPSSRALSTTFTLSYLTLTFISMAVITVVISCFALCYTTWSGIVRILNSVFLFIFLFYLISFFIEQAKLTLWCSVIVLKQFVGQLVDQQKNEPPLGNHLSPFFKKNFKSQTFAFSSHLYKCKHFCFPLV